MVFDRRKMFNPNSSVLISPMVSSLPLSQTSSSNVVIVSTQKCNNNGRIKGGLGKGISLDKCTTILKKYHIKLVQINYSPSNISGDLHDYEPISSTTHIIQPINIVPPKSSKHSSILKPSTLFSKNHSLASSFNKYKPMESSSRVLRSRRPFSLV